MSEHDESNVVVIDQVELGVDVESGCGVVDLRCRHRAMAENTRADCRGMYSWWWDSHISPKNSKWLRENLRDMDVKVKQMIKIIEEDADSFARRAEMYYKRRPELMKLAEDFYRAYRALAERYGHATGVLRFAHKTMAETFPDKVKSMPANGRTFVNCGDDSDDMPPEAIDFDFAALMGFPEGFLAPDSRAGFDVLDGLFDSSSIEKSCFYSCIEVEGFEQAMTGTEEAEKEAAAIVMAKSLERITDLELELARVQDNCHQLEERAKEAESEIRHTKKAHLELEAAREAHLLEYQKCLSEIEEIRTRASQVESELKEDVIREKTEKESAIQAFSRCLGMLSKLQKRFQHFKENAGEFGNESEFETLDHHLETVEEGCFFVEKLNLDLLSGLDALTQKMQSKDAGILEKQKEQGRFWTGMQEDRLHHFNAEDSLQKLKNIWFQSQEETRSLFAQLQEKVQLLGDAESRIECSYKEIHKVQENTVLSKANAASSDLIRLLEKTISRDNEKLQKLEADSERQSTILQKVRSIGLDPENLVPSINELYAKFLEMKRMLEQERSERTALQVKLVALDEFVEKNVLLEVEIFHLETQLEEFQDKVQFLKESCKSLLEERLKTTHERDSLASQLQEAADQSNKLKEMNHRLETSLLSANSQLEALMVRAKGIKDYLQNAEKDHEELQNKYLVLEKEKESLMSKIVQLQIELDMKEECEEELEKSLHANMDGLFSRRAVQDFEEKNSSFLFKFQTLVEAWKFSQVQISYLEQENLVQQSELQFLSDQIDAGEASIHVTLKSYPRAISPEEPFKLNCDYAKNIIQKVHNWHESLAWIEEAYLEASVEKSVLGFLVVQIKQESTEVVSDLNTTKIENHHLKELLERTMNESREIKSENDLLQCGVPRGKDLLVEKESRNMKNEKMLKAVDGEKAMQRKLYNLKMELANTKLAKEDQEKQILKLSDDLTQQIVESESLREEIRRMEYQLLKVSEEYREVCRKERTWSNTIEIGEAHIAAVFCDVVSSNLREAVLEDRVCEVAEAYQKERKGKNTEIERLREFVWSLESDNAELVSQLDALKMEANRPEDESAMEQNGSAGVSAGDATKDNKESNLKRHDPGIGPGDDDNVKVAEMIAFYQPASEISLAQNEFMTKEIVLDQSFGFFGYAGCKTLAVEADERMLELWETSDASSNIDLKVGIPLKATRLDDFNFDNEARKDGSIHDHCEEDSLDEKELEVDMQEISESAANHKQRVSKRRIMERLNTDAQKLTNLHITLNDLQSMVELILRSVQEGGGEYDAINAQLEEARITTTKLSEANTKLIKAVEKWFHTKPTKPTSEAMDDGGSFIRRRISKKARRGSEKVAKLQTEVQKMQFLLLKLGEQKENKGRARVVDRKPRVLLKDYLNSRLRGGGAGGGQKQKKGQFCACVQLPNRRN